MSVWSRNHRKATPAQPTSVRRAEHVELAPQTRLYVSSVARSRRQFDGQSTSSWHHKRVYVCPASLRDKTVSLVTFDKALRRTQQLVANLLPNEHLNFQSDDFSWDTPE
uniref:DUF1508 domain-containing protein n=1 Tax=Steinernema glaseri TaxID=37863 RepID=A0A1I7Z0T6_9BILA